MATTTNYGWTTPDDTALVKDGAAAIRTLGSSVDTTTKNLNPETTLGDIAYRSSTANVKTRLGIGTTGQVLAVSGGVPAWTTPAGSAPVSANNYVDTNEGTTSDTYVDLTTSQSVTLTTGTKVLVIVGCGYSNAQNARGGYMSFAISGATTLAASDANCVGSENVAVADAKIFASRHSFQTVTAGSNTFTAKFRRQESSTASFRNRYITVIDLGS